MFALRVHELAAIVDIFIVLEGTCSFVGEPKKQVFNLHDERIAEFKNRIVYELVPCYRS